MRVWHAAEHQTRFCLCRSLVWWSKGSVGAAALNDAVCKCVCLHTMGLSPMAQECLAFVLNVLDSYHAWRLAN